jgi:hypothetical protein
MFTLDPTGRFVIPVNYSLSVKERYAVFTQMLMSKEKNLGVLKFSSR